MKIFLKNFLFGKSQYKFFIKNYTKIKDLKIISFASQSMRHSQVINPLIIYLI